MIDKMVRLKMPHENSKLRISIMCVFLCLVLASMVGCQSVISNRDQTIDIHDLAVRVQRATESIKSYRFRAQWDMEQESTGTIESTKVSIEGEFAVPHKVYRRYTVTSPSFEKTRLPYEVLYDGNSIFIKESKETEWGESTSTVVISILSIGPSLGEILQWVFWLREVEELASERIDDTKTIHLKGKLHSQGTFDRISSIEVNGDLELWVGDEDNLIRRALYQVTIAQELIAGDDRISLETKHIADVYFYDYDAAVNIVNPIIE